MISIKGCIIVVLAGRKINPIPSIIHYTTIVGTRKCRSEFGGRINLFPLQHINEFILPFNQIRPVSKTFCESLDCLREGLPA
jgi:hypothetical protein